MILSVFLANSLVGVSGQDSEDDQGAGSRVERCPYVLVCAIHNVELDLLRAKDNFKSGFKNTIRLVCNV